ncbi:N-acetylmuramoyl-L-alanine amidase [Antrihabitans sp. YC3-6]|uniref:N-acetylmuramoyl-L-alanine amidase n=1 Tax=Antrihabitans stalagmiti TaxID=2799499 RepID=A0A934U2K1_9NOCA|nr:N-acetylmuramoyl-L-alanine amidase [Antrihabitans stalagmiti]
MKKSLMKAGLCLAVASTLALPATAHAAPTKPAPTTPTETTEPAAPADMSTKLAGRTVFLDPGHQGTGHSENLSRQVDDGRGGTKDCQTTGMTSMNGVPEHTIAWNVSQLIKTSLESLGASVVLSRNDDTGWGGCVDERAAAASKSGADVAVSIHADGAPAEDHGFHLIIPQLPIPSAAADKAQSEGGLAASKDVRDAYVKAGFSPANYAGVDDGLQTRSDVAGPALTTVPLVFVEMGNGANAEDAALLENGDGQLKHAIAITTGIVTYLLDGSPDITTPARGTPPKSTAPSSSESDEFSDESSDTETPKTPKAKTTPKASTPKADKSGTGSSGDSVPATIMEIVRPLLNALGVGSAESMVDDEMFGLVSNLASQLLGLGLGAFQGTR